MDMTTEVVGLFGLLGIVCGFYISVVGLALTALMLILALLVGGAVFGSVFSLWTAFGAFLAMQVGYFASVVGSALFSHVRRLARKDPRRAESKLTIHHE